MILKIALFALGVAAIAIGGMIFLLGPQFTGQIFVDVLRIMTPSIPRGVALEGADVDSEMRFYAVLWMAYGGIVLWIVRDLPQRIVLARLALLVFMIGGLGRAVSNFVSGAPHVLFVILMWVELITPMALLALSLRVKRQARAVGE